MPRDQAVRVSADAFVTVVAQGARVGLGEADRAVEATLQTLAERIDAGEARHLADALPDEVAPWLGTTTPAERFDVDDFLRRVAEREGTDVETARSHAEAVFIALERALDDTAFSHLSSQLSKDFQPLLPVGPDVEVVAPGAFIERVADRAAIGEEEAVRAIDAVLEALAMRIAGGEVDDLRMRLPVAFHGALDRGRQLSGGKATRMSLEQFVRHVSERLGIPRETASDYVTAVLSVVRDAVGEEWLDVRAQLPDEYTALIERHRG